MKKFVFTATIMLSLAGASTAADCSKGVAKIDDGNRKFAVLVPKAAGLGEQSYDDIGCAVAARNEECATRQGMFDGGAVAYDHLTGAEVPVEKAFFAIRTSVKTPHAYGVVAFKDRAEAEKFAAGHAGSKVVKWFELVDEKLK